MHPVSLTVRSYPEAAAHRRATGAFPPMHSPLRRLALASFLAAAFAGAALAPAVAKERTVMVGGAAMYPSKTIVENAVNSKDHTTLVAAVKAAGLVDTLNGAGPFTVFAPTNAAFAKLPAGTVDTLLKPENKGQLTAVLTYHVVPGRLTAADLKDGASLTTVQGAKLMVHKRGGKVMLMDAKGGMSNVTIANVYQSNGVIHVVDPRAAAAVSRRSLALSFGRCGPSAGETGSKLQAVVTAADDGRTLIPGQGAVAAVSRACAPISPANRSNR